MYGAFLEEPGWTPSSLLASKVLFASRTNPRIQMADMIAREAMKDLDRKVGPVQFPERRSKVALATTGAVSIFALGQAHLEAERERNAVFEQDGFNEAAYHNWLRRKNAQDTWDNKVRFLRDFDAD